MRSSKLEVSLDLSSSSGDLVDSSAVIIGGLSCLLLRNIDATTLKEDYVTTHFYACNGSRESRDLCQKASNIVLSTNRKSEEAILKHHHEPLVELRFGIFARCRRPESTYR